MVRAIAANHDAARVLPIRRPDAWLWNDAISGLERCSPPPDLADWIVSVVKQGRPWALGGGLPICHNDYSTSNTVWTTDVRRQVFIDFTNAINAPPQWDLATFCADLYLRSAYPGSIRQLEIAVAEAYGADDGLIAAVPAKFVETAVVQRTLFRSLDSAEAPHVWQKLRQVRPR